MSLTEFCGGDNHYKRCADHSRRVAEFEAGEHGADVAKPYASRIDPQTGRRQYRRLSDLERVIRGGRD